MILLGLFDFILRLISFYHRIRSHDKEKESPIISPTKLQIIRASIGTLEGQVKNSSNPNLSVLSMTSCHLWQNQSVLYLFISFCNSPFCWFETHNTQQLTDYLNISSPSGPTCKFEETSPNKRCKPTLCIDEIKMDRFMMTASPSGKR